VAEARNRAGSTHCSRGHSARACALRNGWRVVPSGHDPVEGGVVADRDLAVEWSTAEPPPTSTSYAVGNTASPLGLLGHWIRLRLDLGRARSYSRAVAASRSAPFGIHIGPEYRAPDGLSGCRVLVIAPVTRASPLASAESRRVRASTTDACSGGRRGPGGDALLSASTMRPVHTPTRMPHGRTRRRRSPRSGVSGSDRGPASGSATCSPRARHRGTAPTTPASMTRQCCG
jgi:hypothetical protein